MKGRDGPEIASEQDLRSLMVTALTNHDMHK